MQIEKIYKNSALDITNKLNNSGIKWVRLNFCDPFGFLHQISVNSNEITEDSFEQGLPRLDGSSIKGFKEIYESDMLLKPDPTTFALLPDYFDKNHHNGSNYMYPSRAARMFVDIYEGYGGKRYSRDCRYIAQKAEEVIKNKGFEKSYWGPELEFFVFNKINLLPNPMSSINCSGGSGYSIESAEAPWNSSNTSAYTIPFKGGYFPAPPADSLTDLRDEVSETLQDFFGIKVEAHHHEVATAGQCEIQMVYDELTNVADNVITYKKTVKEVAAKRDMIANFMPKPIALDNGSGMHVSQSLWIKKKNRDDINAFFELSDEYAELSQTAHYYIGGLIEHAESLCAITNPTTNSYRRLIPGYEAPINVAWSKMNRSASVRIPSHYKNMEKGKRIEYRTPDPSSNIYLVEAALLLAGLDGINKKISPPEHIDKDIYKLTEQEKRDLGIKKLPTSLLDAIECLESDNEFLKPAFTNDFLEMFCQIKKDEYTTIAAIPSPREFYMYGNI